jgi:hypothetical protein
LAVLKRIGFVLIVFSLVSVNCSRFASKKNDQTDYAQVLGTVEGMKTYLIEQELAELESAELWQSRYGDGLRLTTKHYEILTTLMEPLMLRQVPRFMESAYRGYNEQLPDPIETTHKFKVYLFADREQWVDFTRSFTGDKAELFCRIKAGAYCHNATCVTYNIGSTRTFSALGHEGWHQFNSRHFEYRLPSWLDEGVAMLFEHYEFDGEKFRFESGGNDYRLDALAATIENKQMIRLRDLLAMNPGEVLATDEEEAVMAFYSQSYALVRFLREATYGERLSEYRQLLRDALRGDWPIDNVSRRIARDRNEPRTVLWNRIVGTGLFENYIDEDIEKVERQYIAYCRSIAGKSN